MTSPSPPSPVDFFISYTQSDRIWAEWIGWELEQARCTTIVQAWDFRPGADWVHEMHAAIQRAAHTIPVLSPAYLESSPFGGEEWRAAFANDPSGEQRKLIPVRVELCRPTGLLRTRVYVDLVGRAEPEARQALLDGIRERGARPSQKPPFPDTAAPPGGPRFPAPCRTSSRCRSPATHSPAGTRTCGTCVSC